MINILYFIIPLIIEVPLINEGLFPYNLLVGIISVIVWTFLIFRSLYKEHQFYKFYSKEDSRRAELIKDPRRFHLSVLYILGAMLRTDNGEEQVDKMSIMVRYILEVIPAEYREEAIEVLDFLTKRTNGKGDYEYSVINKKYIFANKEQYFFQNIKHDGRILNKISGWRMAEELSLYISETDCQYIMFLLFRMAIADGKVTTGSNQSEEAVLKKICINGLKIEEKALEELHDEWKKGNLEGWYQTHIANKGNYPASNVIADLFSHLTNSNFYTEEKESVPTSNLSNLNILIRCEFAAMWLIAVFYYFYSGFSGILCHNPSIGLMLALLILSTLLFLVHLFAYQTPHSSTLHLLRTKVENTIQKNSIRINFLTSLFTSLGCWFMTTNTGLIIANETYPRGQFTRASEVTEAGVSTEDNITTYYIIFESINVSDEDVNQYPLPEVPVKVKPLLEALPYVSGFYLGDVKNDIPISCLYDVECKTYEKARESQNGDIKITFNVGYYGMILDKR